MAVAEDSNLLTPFWQLRKTQSMGSYQTTLTWLRGNTTLTDISVVKKKKKSSDIMVKWASHCLSNFSYFPFFPFKCLLVISFHFLSFFLFSYFSFL